MAMIVSMIVSMTVSMATATVHVDMNRAQINVRSMVMMRSPSLTSILSSKIERINNVIVVMSMWISIVTKWS